MAAMKTAGGDDADQPTTFFHLPRELRDEIYLLADVAPADEISACCSSCGDLKTGGCSSNQWLLLKGLLTLLPVSRQVNSEVWQCFFRITTIRMPIPTFGVDSYDDQGLRVVGHRFRPRCMCRVLVTRASKLHFSYQKWNVGVEGQELRFVLRLEILATQMEDKWVFRIEEASHDLYNKDHEYKTVDRERLDGMEETLWDKLVRAKAIDKAMTYRGIQWMWEELWLIHSGNASYAVEA